MPNAFGLCFGNDAINSPQLKDQSIGRIDISSGRCPIYDCKCAQSGVDCSRSRTDFYIRRFLGSFTNGRDRCIDPIRVALKRKLHNFIFVIFRGSREVVLYSLFHDHCSETNPLVIAGDGRRNGLLLLHARIPRKRREPQRCKDHYRESYAGAHCVLDSRRFKPFAGRPPTWPQICPLFAVPASLILWRLGGNLRTRHRRTDVRD
jgi:hypothetical protein